MSDEIENLIEAEVVDPALFNEVVIFGTDWTTETIDIQMKKGNILLNPKFQRRIAWKEERKSQFIESLIFGVPVPQILLSQRSDGKYIVLDGKQRLTAIEDFFSGELALRGMTLDTSLAGLTIEELKMQYNDYYTLFCNRPIRTTVIKNCKHESILHQIFLRVNTGSVPLSPQELRQALHPGPFVDFANEFTSISKPLFGMLGLQEPDYRMRDVDIFVRSMAFYFYSPEYTGNMGPFLDSSCEKLNKRWATDEQSIRETAEEFNKAIIFTQEAFEEKNSFRVWSNKNYNRTINRAVVDIMAYYFMIPSLREVLRDRREQLVTSFKEVSINPDFSKAVGFSTNSSNAVKARFSIWGTKLKAIAPEVKFDIPF